MQINHKQSNKKSDIDDILNDDAYGSMLPDHHKRTVITCLTINATFQYRAPNNKELNTELQETD